jgi:hypothetical protein
MPMYGAPQGQFGAPQGMQGGQQSGVVGSGSGQADVEGQTQQQQLPPRPQQAKAVLKGFVDRFRK